MMINYCGVFGTDEAIKNYRETGKFTKDNIKGIGRWYIAKRQDVINYLIKDGDEDRAACFDLNNSQKHFVDNFHIKPECDRTPKKFKSKLWVVEMLKDSEPKTKTPLLVKLITVAVYPLKWIPRKRTLNMGNYKTVKYQWGDVINGFSVEFHIPKKFSFN